MHVLRCESENERWQATVIELRHQADVVIVDVSRVTQNIAWEVEQALTCLPAQRVVLADHGENLNAGAELRERKVRELANGISRSLADCPRVAIDERRFGRTEKRDAVERVRELIQQARFEYDRDELARRATIGLRNVKRFDRLGGWLWLPVGELVITCVISGVLALVLAALLFTTPAAEFEQQDGLRRAALLPILWWYFLRAVLFSGFALYLIRGPLRRRARTCIVLMLTWYTIRIWCGAIELYVIGGMITTEVSAVSALPWQTLAVLWLIMAVYLAKSKRVQATFCN
jgi:hypothetical protein